MPTRVITPPPPLVTLEEAKLALGVTYDERDAEITTLIKAAQAEFDGPTGWLGKAIGEQTLEYEADGFCGRSEHGWAIPLIYAPAKAPIAITYVDAAGAQQTLAEEAYELWQDAWVRPITGTTWPATRGLVRIRYVAAGLAENDPDRERVKVAIKLHVKKHFDLERPEVYDQAIKSLLSGMRNLSI